MSESFDPYRKWLGIPEQDQPPNHYRLLGIERFESDPEVIANAADGRMAQVKNFQAGRYSAESQRLLNELAAAKVCLLNPEKKAAYDRELRARMLASPEGVSAAPAAPPPPRVADLAALPRRIGPTAPPIIRTEFPASRTASARVLLRSKPSPWLVPLILLGAATVFIVVMAISMQHGREEAPPSSAVVPAGKKSKPAPPAQRLTPKKPLEPEQPGVKPAAKELYTTSPSPQEGEEKGGEAGKTHQQNSIYSNQSPSP